MSDLGHSEPTPNWTPAPRKGHWRLVLSIAVIALMVAGIVLGLHNTASGPKEAPAANTSSAAVPFALATPASPTSSSAASAPAVTSEVAVVAGPSATTAAKPVAAPPGTKTVHVSAPASKTPTVAACRPLKILGGCYLVGEYCPTADHGLTGISDGGQPIRCTLKANAWTWELG